MRKTGKPLFLFYLLVAYVLLQFGWWARLLADMNREVSAVKTELIREEGHPPGELEQRTEAVRDKAARRWLMIAGEGTVFFVLLVLGILKTRKAFLAETAAVRQQRNFQLSVSHELKSPLASVRLAVETIAKHGLPEERKATLAGNALKDIDRLNALVDNILLAARIEGGNYRFHPEEDDLSGLVRTLTEKAAAEQQGRRRISADAAPGISAAVDHNAFASVVLNLIENALKYSPENSNIAVRLHKDDRHIMLEVADEGPGIPDDEKERVFEKFYRMGNEEVRHAPGTGLGLYIAKFVTESHGGKISVKDNAPKGSRFVVELPLVDGKR